LEVVVLLFFFIGKAWLIAVFFWEGWLLTPEAAVKGGFRFFWGVAKKTGHFGGYFVDFGCHFVDFGSDSGLVVALFNGKA
jgi:hypothetical protein